MALKKTILKCVIVSSLVMFATSSLLYICNVNDAAKSIYRRQYNAYEEYLEEYEKECDKIREETKALLLQQENEKGSARFQIDYSVSKIYNHSVGNEWSYHVYVDSKVVKKGSIFTFPLNTEMVLTFECIEDDAIPDVGSTSTTISLDETASHTYSGHVTTTETSGRYKGNTAYHEFNINFRRYIDDKTIEAAADFPEQEPEPDSLEIRDSLTFFDVLKEKTMSMSIVLIIILLICIHKSYQAISLEIKLLK